MPLPAHLKLYLEKIREVNAKLSIHWPPPAGQNEQEEVEIPERFVDPGFYSVQSTDLYGDGPAAADELDADFDDDFFRLRTLDCEKILEGILSGRRKRWLIQGPPGSGKTTVFGSLTGRLADPEHCAKSKVLPFPVRSKDLFRIIKRYNGSKPTAADVLENIFVPVLDLFFKRELKLDDDEHEEFMGNIQSEVSTYLADGRGVVLVDGLDEQAKMVSPGRLIPVLKTVSQVFPDCPIVITSRVVGLPSPVLADFQTVHIRPFTDERARKLVDRYGGDRQNLPALIEDFKTPLLLVAATLCAPKNPDGLNFADWIRLIARTIMLERPPEKTDKPALDKLEKILSLFAFRVSEQRAKDGGESGPGTLTGAGSKESLDQIIEKFNNAGEKNGTDAIWRILNLGRDGVTVEFRHRSFFEFYLALYLFEDEKEREDFAARFEMNSEWREVVVYFAGLLQSYQLGRFISSIENFKPPPGSPLDRDEPMQYRFRMACRSFARSRRAGEVEDKHILEGVAGRVGAKPYLAPDWSAFMRNAHLDEKTRKELSARFLDELQGPDLSGCQQRSYWMALATLQTAAGVNYLCDLLWENRKSSEIESIAHLAESIAGLDSDRADETFKNIFQGEANYFLQNRVALLLARRKRQGDDEQEKEKLFNDFKRQLDAGKKYAAQAMALLDETSTVALLKTKLKSSDLAMVQAAVRVLGELGDTDSKQTILNFAENHPSEDVRAQALRSAGFLKPEDGQVKTLVESGMRGGPKAVAYTLHLIGQLEAYAHCHYAVDYLKQGLQEDNAGRMREACYAIGKCKSLDPESHALLMQTFRDAGKNRKFYRVQVFAARALLSSDFANFREIDQKTLDVFLQYPANGNLSVSIARTIHQLHFATADAKERAQDWLLQGLSDQRYSVARAAAEALERIDMGPQGI